LYGKHIGVASLTFQGSSDVIGHVNIWFPIRHFLLCQIW